MYRDFYATATQFLPVLMLRVVTLGCLLLGLVTLLTRITVDVVDATGAPPPPSSLEE